jgi:23S rRNA pseudouridine1911/1915/1917 synthase
VNDGYVYRHAVQRADAGRRLLEHYAQRFTHATEAEWRARIELGVVLVNGARVAPDRELRMGDEVTFHRPPWEEPDVPLVFGVVFEDEHVLVVDKPAGLQVQPGGAFLEHTLWRQVRRSAPERADASPVHRLGRGTSGLVLFGLTNEARAALSAQFRRLEPCKTYLALARGTTLPDSVQARHTIGTIPHGPLTVWCARPDGKPAHTRIRVLARDVALERSLVAAQPITGRADQIRIHLAACGAPLVGDELFAPGGGIANDIPPGRGGYFLHAAALRFEHPAGRRWVKVRTRAPWL